MESASEFLSSAGPAAPAAEIPPVPAGDALDLGEVAVEELPPVEVDVEEIAEAPEPAAPPPPPARAPLPHATIPQADGLQRRRMQGVSVYFDGTALARRLREH